MFRNVCYAPFRSNEWKWLIFICSFNAGCNFIIVRSKSSKSSNISLIPSNVIGEVLTGRIVIDCGLFWRLTSTSANRFIGSWDVSGTSGSGAGRFVSRERFWVDSCLSKFRFEWIRLVRTSPLGVGSSCYHVRTTVPVALKSQADRQSFCNFRFKPIVSFSNFLTNW